MDEYESDDGDSDISFSSMSTIDDEDFGEDEDEMEEEEDSWDEENNVDKEERKEIANILFGMKNLKSKTIEEKKMDGNKSKEVSSSDKNKSGKAESPDDFYDDDIVFHVVPEDGNNMRRSITPNEETAPAPVENSKSEPKEISKPKISSRNATAEEMEIMRRQRLVVPRPVEDIPPPPSPVSRKPVEESKSEKKKPSKCPVCKTPPKLVCFSLLFGHVEF